MKVLTASLLSLLPIAASVPVEPVDASPVQFTKVVGRMPQWDENLNRRQDDFNWEYVCAYVTPNTGMPTEGEATAMADYLVSLGDKDCVIERPLFSNDPVHQVLVSSGNSKSAFYFNPEAGQVFKATMYCYKLGEYFKALINACKKDGRVQGFTKIPNCPNKGIVFPVNYQLSESPGLSIEIVPK